MFSNFGESEPLSLSSVTMVVDSITIETTARAFGMRLRVEALGKARGERTTIGDKRRMGSLSCMEIGKRWVE